MGWIFLFRVHALIRDSPAYAGNTVPRAVKEILDQDHPPACAGNTPSSKMSSYAYCTSLLEPPKYSGIRNKWLKLLIRIPFSYVRLVAISG